MISSYKLNYKKHPKGFNYFISELFNYLLIYFKCLTVLIILFIRTTIIEYFFLKFEMSQKCIYQENFKIIVLISKLQRKIQISLTLSGTTIFLFLCLCIHLSVSIYGWNLREFVKWTFCNTLFWIFKVSEQIKFYIKA